MAVRALRKISRLMGLTEAVCCTRAPSRGAALRDGSRICYSFFSHLFYDEVAHLINPHLPRWRQHGSRVVLGDDGRPSQLHPWQKSCTIIDWSQWSHGASGASKNNSTVSHRGSILFHQFMAFHLWVARQAARFEADIDNLDMLARIVIAEALLVGRMEANHGLLHLALKGDDQFVGLPFVAQVKVALQHHLLNRNTFAQQVSIPQRLQFRQG